MAHHVLVACMPKSASTFITNAMAGAAGLERVNLIPSYGRREQELCEIRLADNARLDYVAQLHIKHSDWTEQLCRDHDISTIVLIRSLFDVVVSLRDHAHRESPISPVLYLDKQHLARSGAELEHMIAMLAIPWYVNFYMGWRSSKAARIFLYEDFVADPDRELAEMLDFAGIALGAGKAAAGLEAAGSTSSRINVGKAGRGLSLEPKTVTMIMDMLAAYPEIQDDRYVLMMKEQAARILAGGAGEEVAARPAVAVPDKQDSRQPLAARAGRYLRRKTRLFGRRPAQALAVGLLACAGLYYTFMSNLIPNSWSGGRIDDLAVPAICIFVAARLLTRVKIKPVPVLIRSGGSAAPASSR
jgi:Sulfotransferase domain